jgi:hypothetical protein
MRIQRNEIVESMGVIARFQFVKVVFSAAYPEWRRGVHVQKENNSKTNGEGVECTNTWKVKYKHKPNHREPFTFKSNVNHAD